VGIVLLAATALILVKKGDLISHSNISVDTEKPCSTHATVEASGWAMGFSALYQKFLRDGKVFKYLVYEPSRKSAADIQPLGFNRPEPKRLLDGDSFQNIPAAILGLASSFKVSSRPQDLTSIKELVSKLKLTKPSGGEILAIGPLHQAMLVVNDEKTAEELENVFLSWAPGLVGFWDSVAPPPEGVTGVDDPILLASLVGVSSRMIESLKRVSGTESSIASNQAALTRLKAFTEAAADKLAFEVGRIQLEGAKIQQYPMFICLAFRALTEAEKFAGIAVDKKRAEEAVRNFVKEIASSDAGAYNLPFQISSGTLPLLLTCFEPVLATVSRAVPLADKGQNEDFTVFWKALVRVAIKYSLISEFDTCTPDGGSANPYVIAEIIYGGTGQSESRVGLTTNGLMAYISSFAPEGMVLIEKY
jgi:hypothetical protein